MSRKPSTRWPRRSAGADNRSDDERADALVAAAETLSGRGIFGLVWLDQSLRVAGTYGRLAEFVNVGEPVGEAVPPLDGLDDTIQDLKRGDSGRIFMVPSVLIRTPGAPSDRLNLTLVWVPRVRRTALLISRTVPGGEIDQHLSQQIRARLMAEADATALARQLARANRDLEEFAAIITHDLKAPMRAMRFLIEDAAVAMTAADETIVREKLARVREQSQRLSGMLNALFDYSRTGYKQDVVARVDTRALATQIVRSLTQRPGLTVELTGDWPVLETVAAPLDVAIRNLIDNAIKHHDRHDIHIEVSASDAGQHVALSVVDDGPGIDPRHHAAIFLPFRRLSEREDPASNGLGLALVKRMVDSVGGSIEVRSDPADRRGTTFRMLWPKVIKV